MDYGRVYLWTSDPSTSEYGRLTTGVELLPRLMPASNSAKTLSGKYVRVSNGTEVYDTCPTTGAAIARHIGDATPNSEGDFLFEPGRGGGRLDKTPNPASDFLWRYTQAARFGEVNTYYHLDRIAAYVDELLHELGASPLPRVTAVVNAHHAITECNGRRDGVKGRNQWLPFQGGHYRLPSQRSSAIVEFSAVAPEGEIHLGPGWRLLDRGALVEAAGGRYRANASHNAGIIYHEYGHHITRHTADFCANSLRDPQRQSNRKSAIDEGTCDYWAATMLGTPHVWILHRSHEASDVHVRSLVSKKTMDDFDPAPQADPHSNGTVWGAALWDLRTRLDGSQRGGARYADTLVLKSLLLIGELRPRSKPTVKQVRIVRNDFSIALDMLVLADTALC